MKKFFNEFKQFITRGNVLDMAVGMIVGAAFTAIISALVNNILTPLINWIPGADQTGALQVVLREAVVNEETKAVITPALVIDFGAVISAVVSFLITAFVLFLIVKAVNTVRNGGKKLAEKSKKKKKGEEEVVEEAPAPAPAPVTTEQLLAEIRDLLKAQNPVLEVSDVAAEQVEKEEQKETK